MIPDVLSQREGAIATVTLFNPDKLNALDSTMWRRLTESLPRWTRMNHCAA